ncbi:MAG: exosortase/archaeosortase family protein [Planctomyces sp.]|jgi:exosortase
MGIDPDMPVSRLIRLVLSGVAGECWHMSEQQQTATEQLEVAAPSAVSAGVWGGATVPVLLLLAAHLPFAVLHYVGTWKLEHYQFFPFALGMFAWLFHTRRDPSLERWGWFSLALIGVDLMLLVASVWLSSPWLAVAGLLAVLTAWCRASRERGYGGSLLCLSLLLVLTLRLPNDLDTQLIQWLQGRTTSLASGICHRIGLVHFSDGNILTVPGKQFLIAEACSGVKSLFTIMFIAALVIAMKRRSVLHGLTLVLLGMGTAGLMNTVRVLSVIMVWEQYQFDLSTGWIHDALGYVTLGIAALMLMSADAGLDLLTAWIPDIRRPGAMAIYANPFIHCWNWYVATSMPDPESDRIPARPLATRALKVFAVAAVLALAGQAIRLPGLL